MANVESEFSEQLGEWHTFANFLSNFGVNNHFESVRGVQELGWNLQQFNYGEKFGGFLLSQPLVEGLQHMQVGVIFDVNFIRGRVRLGAFAFHPHSTAETTGVLRADIQQPSIFDLRNDALYLGRVRGENPIKERFVQIDAGGEIVDGLILR